MSSRIDRDDQSPGAPPKILRRLELYFAILTVLGASVLAIGNDGAVIPMIAMLFAIIGYLFVDLLKWFALPPTAAYIAMAIAAVVCIADFSDVDSGGPRKLLAVAHLLVLVQAILMMQVKTKRIFEQLAIFCLLELIVAAVFNHAISFGLVLIPIAVVAATALSLLSVVSTMESNSARRPTRDRPSGPGIATATSGTPAVELIGGRSADTIAAEADRRSKWSPAIFAPAIFAPAIFLVAAVFFFALPRTSQTTRSGTAKAALVGFSDRVQLEQMGQMLQNPAIALRVELVDRSDGDHYRAADGIYLRGRVLEQYSAQHGGRIGPAIWEALDIERRSGLGLIPIEFVPRRSTDGNFYDVVNVSVSCESMRNHSLFAIAPYHRSAANRNVQHVRDRWTLQGRNDGGLDQPQIDYSFGTHAFRNGLQTEWIARPPQEIGNAPQQAIYRKALLAFDPESMPTIAALATNLAEEISESERSGYAIAKSIERHFGASNDYTYSLNLDAANIPGLDPIEQFVRVNRVGHCQFFASAAAMMLRSQNIPARVVVGYYTDEYNEWSHHYVARQSHAHAWVEALIEKDSLIEKHSLSDSMGLFGQPETDQYWLRLDPTPSADRGGREPGAIRQSIDLAQEWWEENVIEMDADQQQQSPIAGGIQPQGQWYRDSVAWLTGQIRGLRAGELDRGSIAAPSRSSSMAMIGLVGCVVVVILMTRAVWRNLRQKRMQGQRDEIESQPKIEFYAAALRDLARIGIHRQRSETPAEFAAIAVAATDERGGPSIQGPMERLTARFYRDRYGGRFDSEHDQDHDPIAADLMAIRNRVDSMLAIDAEPARHAERANEIRKEPKL